MCWLASKMALLQLAHSAGRSRWQLQQSPSTLAGSLAPCAWPTWRCGPACLGSSRKKLFVSCAISHGGLPYFTQASVVPPSIPMLELYSISQLQLERGIEDQMKEDASRVQVDSSLEPVDVAAKRFRTAAAVRKSLRRGVLKLGQCQGRVPRRVKGCA